MTRQPDEDLLEAAFERLDAEELERVKALSDAQRAKELEEQGFEPVRGSTSRGRPWTRRGPTGISYEARSTGSRRRTSSA